MRPTTLAVQKLIAVTSCVLALNACASLKVNSYVERGADLNQYRTYAWGPADTWSTGDPRLDNNTVFTSRVRSQVDKHLTAKGLEATTSALPDVFVHFHMSMSQRLDVRTVDDNPTTAQDSGDRVYVYDAGTLLVELIDARSSQVVWRGWADDTFDGVIDDQALLEARVDEAVQKILHRLPRL